MMPRFPAPGGWDQFSDDLSDGGLTENEDSYDSYAETANGSETLSGVTVTSSDCFSLSESGWDDNTDDDAVSGMTDDDVSTDCYSMSDQGQDSTLNGAILSAFTSFTNFLSGTDSVTLHETGSTPDGAGSYTLNEDSSDSYTDNDHGADTLSSGTDDEDDNFTDNGGSWDSCSLHQVDAGLTIDEQAYDWNSNQDDGLDTAVNGDVTSDLDTYSTADNGWDSFSSHQAAREKTGKKRDIPNMWTRISG